MGLDTRGGRLSPECRPGGAGLCCRPSCHPPPPAPRRPRPPTMVMLAWPSHPRPAPPGLSPEPPTGGGGSHNGEGGGIADFGGGEGGVRGGGGGGRRGGGRGPDEDELGAFWEWLDAEEIRPVKPLPSCPESQKIFSEHKEMARKYLVLQQEIFNLRQRKTTLEEKLSQAEKLERIGNQRYQSKIQELESKRESLRHNHSRLRQQLEQIRARQEEQRQRQQQEEEEDGDGEPTLDLSLTPP